ncbi:hypothetical protein WMF27_11225 [Sorangium sp. So ce281]|uniref:hypothetical protein n=1 Tax=unclassified Sorangium TaxID=2621164 RepID=UPI003F630012
MTTHVETTLPEEQRAEPSADASAGQGAAAGEAVERSPSLPREAVRRLASVCFWITMALCLALLACKTVVRFDLTTLWDDAYMFQRYAHNIIADHSVSWNPKGPPSYGLTSLAFIVAAVPFHLIAGGNTSLAAMLQSLVWGPVLLVLLALLVLRAAGDGKVARLSCFTLVAFCVARSTLTDHFVSGMDTSFGLCFLTAYLLLTLRLLGAARVAGGVALGAFGGLAFSVRPELTAYAVLVPLALVALERDRDRRRFGLAALAATAGVLALHLVAAKLYFGSPLPLPFYAKSTNLYGSGILRAYRGRPTIDLVDWLEFFWPLVTVIALDVLVGLGARQASPGAPAGEGRRSGPRAFWAESSAFDKGVLAATLLCLAYSWLFVVPIMGFSQRFYYAPLPGLIYLACRSATRLARTLSDSVGQPAPAALPLAGVGALAILWLQLSTPLAAAGRDLAGAVAAKRLGHFNIVKHGSTSGPQKYWFAIDRVSKLPDDLVIATTEVGMLGAMNLKKTIIDMAGLNDLRFALEPFSADRFFEAYKPDLIYMPHPHYVQMTEDLTAHREMSRYVVYSKAKLKTFEFGIAVRRDSPYFDRLQQIVKEKMGSK